MALMAGSVGLVRLSVTLPALVAMISTWAVSEARSGVMLVWTIWTLSMRAVSQARRWIGRHTPEVTKRGPQSQP